MWGQAATITLTVDRLAQTAAPADLVTVVGTLDDGVGAEPRFSALVFWAKQGHVESSSGGDDHTTGCY